MTTHNEESVAAREQAASQDISDNTVSTDEPAKFSRSTREEDLQFREKLLTVLNRIAVALEMLEGR